MIRVVLDKLQSLRSGPKRYVGFISHQPKKGSNLKVQLLDGVNDYVTSPVVRVLSVIQSGNVYFETRNSMYCMKVEG